ncbi:MAG: hypothetical protein LJE85_01475 [Gammaproteobacteria bacterium]|jgi:hypothetical protein|nr:hypothetical protein [Gammaproteobacteria bacterium]
MSSTPISNLSLRYRSGIVQRTAIPAIPAVVAIVCLFVDFAMRYAGYPYASWMKDLDIIAFIVLVIGAAALALSAKVEQFDHAAKDYDSDSVSPMLRFHIADGGSGLPVKPEEKNRYVITSKPAPFFDGGSFPAQTWKSLFRH